MSFLFAPWFRSRKHAHADVFRVVALTSLEELKDSAAWPLELKFLFSQNSEHFATVQALLKSGYGVGVRTIEQTSSAILQAVHEVSHLSQENTVIPWLPRLLREGDLPTCTENELRAAERKGVDLYGQARFILERRYEFKKIIIIDLRNQGVYTDEQARIQVLNEALYPYAIDYIIHRIEFDNARTSTQVVQSIIKALFIIGPISHVLEHWVHGIGKLFAASADDLLTESAELLALHGSGFTWRQLMKRSRILLVVLVFATYAALSVEGLVQAGRLGLAGFLFGVSAIALSVATILQSVRLYHESFQALKRAGKLRAHENQLWRMVLRQDFAEPARFGLLLGAICTPIGAVTMFIVKPAWIYNGWALALVGSLEPIIAGAVVMSAKYLHEAWFHRKIRRQLPRSSKLDAQAKMG